MKNERKLVYSVNKLAVIIVRFDAWCKRHWLAIDLIALPLFSFLVIWFLTPFIVSGQCQDAKVLSGFNYGAGATLLVMLIQCPLHEMIDHFYAWRRNRHKKEEPTG